MGTLIVNLTSLKVNGELESFLGTIYPNDAYQEILSHPKLRQKLLDYVLSKLPNRYAALNSDKIISIYPTESLYCSTLEKLEIEELVQQGVSQLILSESGGNFPFGQGDWF